MLTWLPNIFDQIKSWFFGKKVKFKLLNFFIEAVIQIKVLQWQYNLDN